MVITMKDYDEIRKRYLAGERQRHIAKTLGISRNTFAKHCEGAAVHLLYKSTSRFLERQVGGVSPPSICHFIYKEVIAMGVTLRSINYSIDLGYFGFYNLRRRVAELVSPEMGEHYEEIRHAPIFSNREEEAAWWKEMTMKLKGLQIRFPKMCGKSSTSCTSPTVRGQ